jgi:AraC-like DNA-binding protein
VTVVVDTTQLQTDDGFAAWAEVSSQVFEPLQVRRDTPRPFNARLVRHRVGPIDVDHMRADPSAAVRTERLIRRGDPELVALMLQLAGTCAVSQDDRACLVRPGQLTTWHSSRPYVVAGRTSFEALVVHVPRALLRPHVDRLTRTTAQTLTPDAAVPALIAQYLGQLAHGLAADAFDAPVRGHLADGLLDLLRALAPPPATLRARIDAYIDAHLEDTGLEAAAIAGAHHISRSYLNRLYAGAGVRATIKARRLERARHDLAHTDEPVIDIAARWGFASAAHFSRSFHARYGTSPSAFRRA